MSKKSIFLFIPLCALCALATTSFASCKTPHTHFYFCEEIPATCTTDGYKIFSCECGDSYTEKIPASHKWQDGYCYICDTEYASIGLEYVLSEDETYYTVSGIGSCTETEIYIPSSYNEIPVTHIGEQAFERANVHKIILREGITTIGLGAFATQKLEELQLPESVQTLFSEGEYYYADIFFWSGMARNTSSSSAEKATSLKTIRYAGDLSKWLSLTENLDYSLLRFGTDLYLNGEKLTDLHIPDGITSISSSSFTGCTSLTSVHIPQSVVNLCYFNDCKNIEEFSVNEDNNVYRSINGHLFTKDASSLIAYAPANKTETYTVPSTVENLFWRSFNASPNLKKIVVSEGTISISSSTILPNVTEITIPHSVKNLQLFECENPIDIFYSGNLEDWLNIQHYNYNSTVPEIKHIYYNEKVLSGQIILPENYVSVAPFTFHNSDITSYVGKYWTFDIFYGCSKLTSITLFSTPAYFGQLFGKQEYKNSYAATQYNHYNVPQTFYLPKSLTTVNLQTVTNIPEKCFYRCTNIQEINLPDTVTSINAYTFAESGLKKLIIPSSVTELQSTSFLDCKNLETLSLPAISAFKDVGTARTYPFEGLSSLQSIYYEGSIEQYTQLLFCNAITVSTDGPYSDVHGFDLYINDKLLTDVTLTRNLTLAFRGVKSLKNVIIASNVTSLETGIFSYCENLTDIIIPENVTTIHDYAFTGSGLTNISLHENLKNLYCAFTHCKNLKTIDLPNSLKKIDGTFRHSGLEKIVIPDSIIEIGDYSFLGCTNLQEVILPNNLTKLMNGTFEDCTALKSIAIPDSVQIIDNFVFRGCTALQTVNFGNGIQTINSTAFLDCDNLQSLLFKKSGEWTYTYNYTMGEIKVNDNNTELINQLIDPGNYELNVLDINLYNS